MATKKKKAASEEDVIAMRQFWTGAHEALGAKQDDPDPDVTHNTRLTKPCGCRMVRLSHGYKYCTRCFPLPGDKEPEPWTDMTERLMRQRTPMPEVDARIEAFLGRGPNYIPDTL